MPRRKRPVLGVDYIMDGNGRAQFTREYLERRGSCCEHECRFCPYKVAAESSSDSAAEFTISGKACEPATA